MFNRFGSISAMLSADPIPPGNQERGYQRADAMLKACRDLMHHALKERIGARPILATREALDDYLSLTLGNLQFEELHVLFLTNGHQKWLGLSEQPLTFDKWIVCGLVVQAAACGASWRSGVARPE